MFTKIDKYKYSVLGVIGTLNSISSGTMECHEDIIDEPYQWLKWRVTEGWDEAFPSKSTFIADNLIRVLAFEVIRTYKEEFV